MIVKKMRTIKALPEYLQPKILSAVAYINECSPDMKKAVDRINTIREHLTDNCRGFGNRLKDSRPFLHYYDLDKQGYRYATNWEIL